MNATVAPRSVEARIEIRVEKYSAQRQRADRYSDVAYDVILQVSGILGVDGRELAFKLPEFGRLDGVEPYRVDSAHEFRQGAPATDLMTVLLRDRQVN